MARVDGNAAAGRQESAQTLLTACKGWLHDGLELARVRLQLLGLEAGEHARSVAQLLAWAVAAAVLLSLGLGFVAVLFTVLLWDQHRALALTLFAGVFVTLGLLALWMARRQLEATKHWFEASRQELARDAKQLRP